MKGPETTAARVLVVGDVMLDRYWIGDVSRISPEAPVPVVLVGGEERRLGGAANVAWNCAALGARTRLLSVVGADAEGRMLEALLKKEGIEPRSASRPIDQDDPEAARNRAATEAAVAAGRFRGPAFA